MPAKRLCVALLALVLIGGCYVRLAGIGEDPFIQDELTQYFAAGSLDLTGRPLLPSGEVYTRGMDVTHLVRLSVKQWGPSKEAIRLPSALLGVLNLLVFGAVLWYLGGGWVAFWGTLLLAIYPEAIAQSRQLRFYTYQLNFGILAMLTGWLAIRRAGSASLPRPRQTLADWGWLLLTVGAFILATRVQITSLAVAAGWLAAVAVAALIDGRAHGRAAWRHSAPLQFFAGVSVAMVLGLAVRPGLVVALARKSQEVPYWARLGGTEPLAYYYGLVEAYPLLVSLAPLLFVVFLLRNRPLGVYLALWFAVPVMLHSFVLPWKSERFILLAMPALFTAAAFGITWAVGALFRYLHSAAAVGYVESSRRNLLAGAGVALICISAVVTTPAFNQARKFPTTIDRGPDWSAAVELIHADPRLSGVPFGSSANLDPLYYLGRLDFTVAQSFLESPERTDRGIGSFSWMPVGSADYYSGRPILTTPASIQSTFTGRPAVLVSIDERYLERDLHPELTATLGLRAEEICRGRCGTLRLYYWQFQSEQAQPARSARSRRRSTMLDSIPGPDLLTTSW